MESFVHWLNGSTSLNEDTHRYSVEVNFRSRIPEVLENYAKITLGYVSAALKGADFHVKQVFDDGLIRILVSTRNWDDGEWVVIVSWNPHHHAFVLTKGFYNKLSKGVNYKKDSEKKLGSENAAEIAKEVRQVMQQLKGQPDRHFEKLKKVPLKRGPKG